MSENKKIKNLEVSNTKSSMILNKDQILEGNLTGYASIDMPWLNHFPENVYNTVTSDIEQKMVDFMLLKNDDFLYGDALEYLGKNITYGELKTKIQEYVSILLGYGIRKGDVVSLCLPNLPETVYLKYALNKIGAIANMIEPRHSSNSIVNYVNDSNSKLLFIIPESVPTKIEPVINKLNVENIVIAPFTMDNQYLESISDIIDLVNSNKKYVMLQEMQKYNNNEKSKDLYEPNSVATIVYTSGTTGFSKGAMLSNEAYNCMYNQLKYVTDYRRGETFLGAIPFFSAYGSFCGMHNSLCSGQKILLVPKFVPTDIDKLMVETKPNVAFLVPGYWKAIANSELSKKNDFSNLTLAIAGGDKMDPTSIEEINEFLTAHGCKHKLRVGYGASEFGGAVTVVPEDEDYIAGSAGLILPSCVAMVIDPDTEEELLYNQAGEICISSKTMMNGYLNQESETQKLIIEKNGIKYYKTGDKGYINEHGILFVIDRYKRAMMRPDGHTVHATPIENKILEYDGISDCCVVGLKCEEHGGVIPTAFVVLDDNSLNTEEFFSNVDDHCLQTLSERERAQAYTVIDKLPYNPMGKVDYRKLEQYSLKELKLYVVDETFLKKDQKQKTKK